MDLVRMNASPRCEKGLNRGERGGCSPARPHVSYAYGKDEKVKKKGRQHTTNEMILRIRKTSRSHDHWPVEGCRTKGN